MIKRRRMIQKNDSKRRLRLQSINAMMNWGKLVKSYKVLGIKVSVSSEDTVTVVAGYKKRCKFFHPSEICKQYLETECEDKKWLNC